MLNKEEKNEAVIWLKKNVTPHPRKILNSYVLKHIMQHNTGIYCIDDEFQRLLNECGFSHEDIYQSNFYVVVNPEMSKKFYIKGGVNNEG